MERIRILTVKIMMFCILIGSCLGMMAVFVQAEEDIPGVIFENSRNEAPDLYIKKQVKTAMEGYDPPEDQEFSFVLKLDGELAKRLEYRVFDKEDEEIFDRDILGNRKRFQTDRSGTFALKAGQTALFEYVGSGVRYEVTEQPVEDYVQIQPQGESAAVGTVPPSGAYVNFVNLYIPKSDRDTANLMIQKSISFPEGYEMPETPWFSFQLQLDGRKFSLEQYEIHDSRTDELLDKGVTDSEGIFKIKGGCTAVFREIPTDIDYLVTEKPEDGWYSTKETSLEGTVTAPGTIVNFNNKNVSFAVSKEVEGGESTEEFRFLLTKADRTVWADAAYYLYRTVDGKLVDDLVHQTEKDGSFLMCHGQTAVFIGGEPGTIYNVSEIANPDYVQVLPADSRGYTDKMVFDGVEVLPFINRKESNAGTLSVTKVVENVKGTAAFAQDEYGFLLYRKKLSENEQESVYEPVKNADFVISSGDTELTGQTDAEGKFTIKANETVRFTGLDYGEYKVEESQLSIEYVAKDGQKVQEGILTEEGLQFTFVNLYLCKELDLYLTKKTTDGQPLEGASFMLYRDAALTNAVREEPFVSGADGMAIISDLKAGTYYLKEIRSPEGYRLWENPIKIDVMRVGANMEVTVDDSLLGTDEAGQIYTKLYQDRDDEAYITVYNSRNFMLPMTGGTGVFLFTSLGMLGLTIGTLLYKKQCSHRANQ